MEIMLFAAALLATSPAQAPASTPLAPAERLAAAKAAGFTVRGRQIINECDVIAEMIAFEKQDLNGDGIAELVVSDGGACYGGAGATFTVLRKTDATWTPVLSAQGVMNVLKTRHGGWRDIEIGGPGFARMPVARWTGTKYDY